MQEEMIVLLNGEIDHHRAASIKRDLDHIIEVSRPRRLVLDFSGVSMMDSSGIGLMLGRYKKLRDQNGKLIVRRVNSRIDTVFQVSGLYQVIEKI